MPDPLVVLKMREFKAALLAREADKMAEMARQWVQLEDTLDAQIYALAAELSQQRDAGKYIEPYKLYKLDRYRKLQEQVAAEVADYADYAERIIESGQADYAALGAQHAAEAIQASYFQHSRIPVYFSRLPVSAIENIVGIAGNGAPLGDLLRMRMIDESGAWERLTRTLIDSVALGRNPNDTALLMQNDLAEGLNKALVIARTEQLRVYRQASAQQYTESGVVEGQKRLCAHDGRVCAACLADEGTLYPIDQPIPDHPNGRCTGVPVIRDLPAVSWTSGEQWLNQQSEETQRDVLGNGRYEAWRDGKFNFSDLVTVKHNTTWGDSLQPTPLNQLI